MSHSLSRCRGLAMLVVMSVVATLTMVTTAFMSLIQLERRSSLTRVHATKAALLARSGLEDALARLSASQTVSFEGEDWDNSNTLNGLEIASELFKPGALDQETCPAREALRPSFFVMDRTSQGADGKPASRLLRLASSQRGFSGALESSVYTLKIEDESAKININGGFLDALDRDSDGIPDHRDDDVRSNPSDPKDIGLGWNFQLARILNLLGNHPEVGISDLGTSVVQQRPRGGWGSVSVLQQALGTTQDLSPYVTSASWADEKVIHPNAFSSETGYGCWSDLKMTRRQLALEAGGRPPVNLNAATRPVLVALLQDLTSFAWRDPTGANAPTEIPDTTAQILATAILARRPFGSWTTFEAFCDACVDDGTLSGASSKRDSGGNLAMADLLKSNFNPNTGSNKEMPDQLRWKWMDKSDLLVWSTEGALYPTGRFKISACARFISGGALLAERILQTETEIWTLARHTTQADFVGGRPPADFVSSATAPFGGTTGTSATWGSPSGLSLLTYPAPPTALPGQASTQDGFIALATAETPESTPNGGTLRFLHHFDDGWNADPVMGNPGGPVSRLLPGPGACDTCLQGNPGTPVWPAASTTEPNTLYPDGAHIQPHRAPAFPAVGNFPLSYPPNPVSNHAVFGFWIKSPYGAHIHMSVVRGTTATQALAIGHDEPDGRWGIVLESNDVTGPLDIIPPNYFERQYHVRSTPGFDRLPGLRWQHVCALLDSDETLLAHDVRVWVRDLESPLAVHDAMGGLYSNALTIALNKDILSGAAPAALVLGGQTGSAQNPLMMADHVLDEFALCDFGDDAASALGRAETWGARCYADGRYYKGGDAAFLSPPLRPAAGSPCRLLGATWTARTPDENRCEYRIPSQANLPATGASRPRDPILLPMPGASDPVIWIEVELMEEGASLSDPALAFLTSSRTLGIQALSGFRYRIRIRTALRAPLNEPLLETPYLDDITFAWQAESGPRILAVGAPEEVR